MTNEHVSMKLR